MSPRVIHGELLNIFGRPARLADVTFIAAAVRLERRTGSTEHYFRDHAEYQRAANIIPQYDVAFVRARIPCLFGYTPQPVEIEKTLLSEGFLCATNETDCVPFLCSDYYGRTGLEFSALTPDSEKAAVAAHFWSLLLERPHELAEFERQVEQYGPQPRVTLGCRNGELFAHEE